MSAGLRGKGLDAKYFRIRIKAKLDGVITSVWKRLHRRTAGGVVAILHASDRCLDLLRHFWQERINGGGELSITAH